MDVAYTCPQITLINSLYENGTYPLYCFKLLKRGQNEPGRFHYQLSDFGRIVTAYYYNAPGEARSSPAQVIVRYSDTSSEYDKSNFPRAILPNRYMLRSICTMTRLLYSYPGTSLSTLP